MVIRLLHHWTGKVDRYRWFYYEVWMSRDTRVNVFNECGNLNYQLEGYLKGESTLVIIESIIVSKKEVTIVDVTKYFVQRTLIQEGRKRRKNSWLNKLPHNDQLLLLSQKFNLLPIAPVLGISIVWHSQGVYVLSQMVRTMFIWFPQFYLL